MARVFTLAGANATYVEDLYELYLSDPDLVSEEWKRVFEGLPKPSEEVAEQPHSRVRDYFRRLARETKHYNVQVSDPDVDAKQVKVLQLINAYRFRGHEAAELDPLGLWQRPTVAELDPAFHNLTEDDFEETFNVGSFAVGQETMKLKDIYEALNKTYCGSIGAEYMHMTDTEQKRWIQQRLESVVGQPSFNKDEKRTFLEELTAAEGLERYLGAKFPGAKRFSLEGGDALIPMTKELIRHAGTSGMREVVIGMAHRGRLNMLVNVLGKKPQDLFDEFAGKHDETWGHGCEISPRLLCRLCYPPRWCSLSSCIPIASRNRQPSSHGGSVRARQDRLGDNQGSKVLPITIHGDSAIAGQGVVAETFNMSLARGFQVGGTVRIVINNQVGFTTSNPRDTRSTMYCTDIAKMVQAPIFHVNADDPEAVAFVTRIALDYRNEFKRDVVIDLVCYRRHGHNEADEPNATQPLMYQKIKKHPTPRKLYADILIDKNESDIETATQLVNEYRDALDRGEVVVKEWRPMALHSVDWSPPYLGHEWDMEWDSKYDKTRLIELGNRLCQYPESHKLQSRVNKLYNDRLAMMTGEKAIDWGMAETLAYATLVDDGKRIRLSGQDSGRGTFFHRHSVLHNQTDASTYIPLANIHDNQGPFQVFDSVLSEEAVLAFEYGYATAEPGGLTIWEAQFGDFANGAQVVIDQFISSGEQKWARLCGLTMLLPHGYEGQGPEHSSARLERYLQLCAEQNMQVVVPSTPAQVYHMIRRQVVRPMRRPLIVMSPKSLLRHPLCTSTIEDLADGTFQSAIPEVDDLDPSKVKRVVFCSGKVYFDLLEQRRNNEQDDVAIVRIEQLYPFPMEEVQAAIAQYTNVEDFVWCQEEPQNQGAWYCSQHNFRAAIPAGADLKYAGRPASASPAVGYMSVHLKQQKALVEDALNVNSKTSN
ncbi:LOW QUALITY PROTEIN: 2-oxoglutarate dehydrogenase E1 component [Vibrio sp. JCM 18905]|nr:LOW QUALITY PROTEIN: 2-oxoglutarate dehydrogenase E1 component [Vibrio sp. JCM 18905]